MSAVSHRLQQLTTGGWITLRECTYQYGLGYLTHAEQHGSLYTLRLITRDGKIRKVVIVTKVATP